MTISAADLAGIIAVQAAAKHGLDIHEQWAYIHVKDTDGCQVFIARMLTNWRIVEVEHGVKGTWGPRRGWCYDADLGFESVLEAARRWDGARDSEPSGWKRVAGTERRNGEPAEGIRQM